MAELFLDCDNGGGRVVFISNDKRILEATRTINHRTVAKARVSPDLICLSAGAFCCWPTTTPNIALGVVVGGSGYSSEWPAKTVINFKFRGAMKNWRNWRQPRSSGCKLTEIHLSVPIWKNNTLSIVSDAG